MKCKYVQDGGKLAKMTSDEHYQALQDFVRKNITAVEESFIVRIYTPGLRRVSFCKEI